MDTNVYENIINRLNSAVPAVQNVENAPTTPEDPNKCYVADQIDDNTIDTIQTGEVCTIETAKQYGIFGKNSIFNGIIPSSEKTKIDVHKDNTDNENLDYALCSVKETNAYKNCVLTTKNPWKSINASKEFCRLPEDIILPSGLKYNPSTKYIDKPSKIPLSIDTSALCQERWYDWFTVPDWHFGNGYRSIGEGADKKCYKPCALGKVPTKELNGQLYNKCISKAFYEFGFYASNFNYLPIALIVLLGSNKESLLKYYDYYSLKLKEQIKGLTPDMDLFKSLHEDDTTRKRIYEEIKTDMKYAITNLFELSFNIDHIINPDAIVQNMSIDAISKDMVLNAYEIARKYYQLSTALDISTIKEYFIWKQELADISGFDITSERFAKQLLILKKACNVAFDNTSSYSQSMLYILNKKLEKEEVYKTPIIMDLTQNDKDISKTTTNVPEKTVTSKSQTEIEKEDANKKQAMETVARLFKEGYNINYDGIIQEIKKIKQDQTLKENEKKDKITAIYQSFYDNNKFTDPAKFSAQDKEDIRIFFELLMNEAEFNRISKMLNESDKKQVESYQKILNTELTNKIELNTIDSAQVDLYKADISNKGITDNSTINGLSYTFQIIIFIIGCIILGIILIAILSILWPFIAIILNEIIKGFIYLTYWIVNILGKGEFNPSKLDINLTETQINFLNSKIWYDKLSFPFGRNIQSV
jgi:hypothetical protein